MVKQLFTQLSLGETGETGEKKIRWLSHSAIEGIERCPRCFWLVSKMKIRLPEGIQSRLANRFDIVIKNYFGTYRTKGELPPFIKDKIEGELENPFKEKYFHKFSKDYGFWGKLDECIIHDRKYIPVDFKTASSDPREKEIIEAYQHQIDAYVYLMESNGRATAGYGYLIFFYPDLSDKVHNGFPMVTHIKKIRAHPEEVPGRIKRAIEILEDKIPQSKEDCPFCLWFDKVKDYYL